MLFGKASDFTFFPGKILSINSAQSSSSCMTSANAIQIVEIVPKKVSKEFDSRRQFDVPRRVVCIKVPLACVWEGEVVHKSAESSIFLSISDKKIEPAHGF